MPAHVLETHACVPVTIRREYLWIPEDKTRASRGMVEGALPVPAPPGIRQLYTLLSESRGLYQDPASPPPMDPMSIPLQHDVTVFFEDHIHDWSVRGGQLRYMSRVTAGDVWVLVEFHDPVPQTT